MTPKLTNPPNVLPICVTKIKTTTVTPPAGGHDSNPIDTLKASSLRYSDDKQYHSDVGLDSASQTNSSLMGIFNGFASLVRDGFFPN
tara:strand:- start:543 stop:803 length:261 start_codon:yes stop_codon:yes gene_type:complete